MRTEHLQVWQGSNLQALKICTLSGNSWDGPPVSPSSSCYPKGGSRWEHEPRAQDFRGSLLGELAVLHTELTHGPQESLKGAALGCWKGPSLRVLTASTHGADRQWKYCLQEGSQLPRSDTSNWLALYHSGPSSNAILSESSLRTQLMPQPATPDPPQSCLLYPLLSSSQHLTLLKVSCSFISSFIAYQAPFFYARTFMRAESFTCLIYHYSFSPIPDRKHSINIF